MTLPDLTPDIPRDTGTYADGTPVVVTTQVEHPWRAALRTGLFVWLPLLVMGLAVVPEIIEVVLQEVGKANVTLPTWLYATLAGTSTVAGLIAVILNRLALLPRVNELLTRLRIGPAPKMPNADDRSAV